MWPSDIEDFLRFRFGSVMVLLTEAMALLASITAMEGCVSKVRDDG